MAINPLSDAVDAQINEFMGTIVDGLLLKAVSKGLTGALDGLKDGYTPEDPMLWYLAQDADRRDEKYKDLIRSSDLDEKGIDVDNYIGALQYLNMADMTTKYESPSYRLIYSYGLPTLGNSRRLSMDYLVQKKSHVSQKTFNNTLSDKITQVMKNTLQEEIKNALDTTEAVYWTEDDISKIRERITGRVDSWLNDSTSLNFLKDSWKKSVLQSWDSLVPNLPEYQKKAEDGLLNAAISKGISVGVQELVDVADVNVEDIPTPVVNFLSVIENFVPQKYSTQIMSTVVPSLSPKPEGMEQVPTGASDFFSIPLPPDDFGGYGLHLMAKTMENIPLNFYDQGTIDVPAYSAYGANVALFNNSATSVKRYGYALNQMDLKKHQAVQAYADILAGIGIVAYSQKSANFTLDKACYVVPEPYKTALKAAKTVAGYATYVNMGASVLSAIGAMFGTLDDTKTMAQEYSIQKKNQRTFQSVRSGAKAISYTDMDEFLFESPHASIQAVQDSISGKYKSIPLLLFQTSGDSANVPEISDLQDLKTIYRTSEDDSLMKYVFPLALDTNELKDVNYSSATWYRDLTLKNIFFDSPNASGESGKDLFRHVRRSYIPAFTSKEYIREFRFQIDDVRPDQLWQIKIDFNALTQIVLERDSLYNWNAFIRVNGGTSYDLGTLSRPPVDENGLFVFRPEEFLRRTGAGGIPKAVLSQLEQDGPNLISIMLVNKVGLTSNQQFSYCFIAAGPLMREGWPNSLDYVSSLQNVKISMSNLGYPYDVDSARVRLLRVGDSTEQVMDFVPADIVKNAEKSNTWESVWDINASLGNIIDSLHLADGEYILQWKAATVSRTATPQVTWYTMNTTIFIDTRAPELTFYIPKANLTGTESDGQWGTLTVPDSSPDSLLREVRSFVTVTRGKSLDTLPLFLVHNFGSSAMRFAWGDALDSLSEGEAHVYAQALDYAEPDAETGKLLDSIQSADRSRADSSWKRLFTAQGTFIPGVNGTTAEAVVWIDKTAPSIDSHDADLTSAANPEAEIADAPAYTVPTTENQVTVNARQLLQIKFRVHEPIGSRTSDSVSVQLLFRDSAQGTEESYLRVMDEARDSDFVFTEPSAQKLADGVYTVAVVLTDASGNASNEIFLPQTVRADRRSPLIESVMTAEPVYAVKDDVDSSFAYISQRSDIASNRSDLHCFQRLTVPGAIGDWTALETPDTLSRSGVEKAEYGYSMKSLAAGNSNGRWSTQFGCFDAAGNFSSASCVFGVGNRYPELTYPTSGTVKTFDQDLIVIEGIAPNPVVPNGNEQTSEFKLEWRKSGTTTWASQGIRNVASGVSTLNAKLGVWDRSGLDAGEYEIRLSVRGCPDEADTTCKWVSDIEQVSLGTLDTTAVATKPALDISVPSAQVPGDSAHTISARIAGVADGSQWSMNMNILVADPADTAHKISAQSAYIDSVALSPFSGIPGDALPDGASLWQVGDGQWVLTWKGAALRADSLQAPVVSIGYSAGHLDFATSDPAYSADDSVAAVPPITLGAVKTVTYNRLRRWNLGTDPNQVVSIRFYADQPFMVDLHTIAGADSNQYWGIKRLNYNSMGMGPIPYIYVDADQYKAKMAWNGLTRSGLYPGTSTAEVQIIAMEKGAGGRVITKSARWKLAQGAPEIVSDEVEPGQFIVSGSPDSGTVATLGNIGYSFGITGRPATVSAVVKDSAGTVLRTLWNAVPCVATSDRRHYNVQWDRTTDNNFAVTNAGNYELEISAEDDAGHLATRSYPFVLRYAGALLPAPTATEDSNGVVADLSMDEAFTDSLGNLRFIGEPDYLLTADITARTLPESQRRFLYHWQLNGQQYPSFYRANRFSLGIRRYRRSFPVTVVTLIATQGHDFTEYCNDESTKTLYRMNVQKITLRHDSTFSFDMEVDGRTAVVGYDANGPIRYPIRVAVKILPAYAYEDIRQRDPGFKNGEYTRGRSDLDWDDFWDEGKNDALRNTWFYHWGAPLFWESNVDNFKVNSGEQTLIGSTLNPAGCTPSDDMKDPDHFVCGAKDAEEETPTTIDSFNPHQDMLTVAVSPASKSGSFGTGDYDGKCRSNHGSSRNVEVKIALNVNDTYWDPYFGDNNLANRYLRFDHTNKTLYGEESYFDAGNDILNYYDGVEWRHDSKYGLATAFEAQSFAMRDIAADPLLFADEVGGKKTLSGYQAKFFGQDADNLHYNAILRAKRQVKEFGKKPVVVEEVDTLSSNTGSIFDFGEGLKKFQPMSLEIAVAPAVRTESAIQQRTDISVPYPYSGSWNPESLTPLTQCGESSIRDIDDHEKICYKTYSGASRLHYGTGDWSEAQWDSAFTVNGLLRNPVTMTYGDTVDPVSRNAVAPVSFWSPATTDTTAVVDTFAVDSDAYEPGLNAWNIDPAVLRPAPSPGSFLGVFPHATPVLVPDSGGSAGSAWIVDQSKEKVSSITNAGTVLQDSLRYVRSLDTTTIDLAALRPLGIDVINSGRLQEQNGKNGILGQPWMRHVILSHPRVWSREDTTARHDYFTAEIADSSDQAVRVKRTAGTPEGRPGETVSLRGRVPGTDAAWNLSYLRKGQLVALASGKQPGEPPEDEPYPLLQRMNVNRLQGNTSFFLTYGSNGNIYFRQMDVHIGHRLDNTRSDLLQSMYGNVSVRFPAGSFPSPVDVTVRSVSLADFGYSVFQGLDPVGPVVEILPSHIFPRDSAALWPRISVQISQATLLAAKQNPLDVRIYKPDFTKKQIVPLEEQEIGFYKKDQLILACNSAAGSCSSVPDFSSWDMIEVSGKTPTFSAFLLMDRNRAANVHATDGEATADSAIHCTDLKSSDTLWMGLANGYLEYPYPCSMTGNTLIQLRRGTDIVAEHQALTDTNIIWKASLQDIAGQETPCTSRFTVYGSDGKGRQQAGPVVRMDTAAPAIAAFAVTEEDQAPDKQIRVDAVVGDSESGVAEVQMDMYWAGKLLESRTLAGRDSISVSFILNRAAQEECQGCRAQVRMTVRDRGHNFVSRQLWSRQIYPYPATLALWYPLADGSGNTAQEALGSGEDMILQMVRPWLYGNSLYMYDSADAGSPQRDWVGAGIAPMSVEFRLRPGTRREDRNYSLISWKGPTPWSLSVRGSDLIFDQGSLHVVFPQVVGRAKTSAHYVLTVRDDHFALYKNGVLAAEETSSPDFTWDTRGRPVVGCENNENGSSLPALPGDLSQLRFYTAQLSSEEVYWLYRGLYDINDGDFTVVRATALTGRSGLVVDQSCEVPGMSYLHQATGTANGSLEWTVAPGAGQYRLYVLSRGYTGREAGAEILLDGVSLGEYSLPADGVWAGNAIADFPLASGSHTLTLRPLGQTGIAGLALADAAEEIPGDLVRWHSESWSAPEAVVEVKMQYNDYSDRTWVRPQFRLTNLTDAVLSGLRLRYYYRGEGEETQGSAFYPGSSLKICSDAGDVYYAELALPDSMAAGASAYYGQGPQFGLHRTSYEPWYSVDDPSYLAGATDGTLHSTDKVAVLDGEGNLLNAWSCYEAGDTAVYNPPAARALAADHKLGSGTASLITMVVENSGKRALKGFEIRYYFRESEGFPPVWSVYANSGADTALVYDGNGLYHVSFRDENTVLNPGDRYNYGNGVQFELHHSGWSATWESGDDPSHSGLNADLAPADSVVIFDLAGNLLWGGLPAAVSAPGKASPATGHMITRTSDGFLVQITTAGTYTLSVVTATGTSVQTLYSGTWDAGEHLVSPKNLQSGTYLVLKRGFAILDQIPLQ